MPTKILNVLQPSTSLGPFPSNSSLERLIGANLEAMSPLSSSSNQSVCQPATVPKNKKEHIEAFKEFLKVKKIPSNATWKECLKILSEDPYFENFKTLNEKKQVFNTYKTQQQKEEKEANRLKVKKYKEQFEELLLYSGQITATSIYSDCRKLFSKLEVWNNLCDSDRRDIFDEAIVVLRKRSMDKLANLFAKMATITYQTTFAEVQKQVMEIEVFRTDEELLHMEAEDALLVFEEYIKSLEKEHEKENKKKKKILKRQWRKNRDNFTALLEELHEKGILSSMSLWKELYPIISKDRRYSAMLGQPGSTPLDLFKIYVNQLKEKFTDEKKIIEDILQKNNFEVTADTTFEKFAKAVCEDQRSITLDPGNVKLTYDLLLEKVSGKQNEEQRAESRDFIETS